MKKSNRRFRLLSLVILSMGLCGPIAVHTALATDVVKNPSPISISNALTPKKEGDRLLKMGNVEDAIIAYRKALAIDPSLANAWFNLAIACYNKRDLDGAASALETLIQYSPSDTEALYNLGCLHLYRGDLAQGRKYFIKAMVRERCKATPSALSPLITKAMEFFRFFHSCSVEQQHHLLRLMQDGLEPIPPSYNVFVF